MKRWVCLCVLSCCSLVAGAEEGSSGGYTDLQFDAGAISGTFGDVTRLETFSGGVKIILTSSDPAMKPLPIKADKMDFQYGDNSEKPSLIVMTGNVYIEHPSATVRAEKARWDFNSGELVFSGNPIMNSDRFKDLRGEEMVINFKTNAFSVKKGTASEIPMGDMMGEGGGGDSADASSLAASDIVDWTGLVDALKAADGGASPGAQLVKQLAPAVKNMLVKTPTASLVEMRGDLVKQLNGVLKKPGFYNEAAFAGVALNDEVKALLKKEKLEPQEQSRQNRLLFNAAFAKYMVK